MEWIKEIGRSGGADGGWRNDFPLSHDLPPKLAVDCRNLALPIHPMFAVRLRVFVEWHRHEGRVVEILLPDRPDAQRVFLAMQIDPATTPTDDDEDAVLPTTRLDDDTMAEDAARRTKEILEYQLTDVSGLGEAAFAAVAELCTTPWITAATHSALTLPFVGSPSHDARFRLRSATLASGYRSTFGSGIRSGVTMATLLRMRSSLM